MSNLTPYNRKNNIDEKSNDIFGIERLFESFFNDTLFPALHGSENIRVDIMENDYEYTLAAELPGINKEDISIDLRDDRLTISVQKNEEYNEERENYIRRERKSGMLSRVLYIPNVKEDEVKAKYENGILTIHLPKLKDTIMKRSRIEIE